METKKKGGGDLKDFFFIVKTLEILPNENTISES